MENTEFEKMRYLEFDQLMSEVIDWKRWRF